jgi:Zn-dependent peptidase ImmA (M78 family)/DNA-binding XRE family transcriptional regulator
VALVEELGMAEIPVNGDVLIWAREYRGLSLEEAADRLGITVSELEAFETEKEQPTLTRFEKFAAVYKLPLSTLFRLTPPQVPSDLPDFRTLEGAARQKSLGFQIALDTARSFQSVLMILRSEDENFFAPALREYSFTKDPSQQGEDERTLIGVSVDRQLDWKPGDGFRHWRAVIERLGISVYLQKFELADCRGFCIWDEGQLPAIVVNKSEISENARTFTLIHEYAHLLIRRPGISDQKRMNPTEAFCNRFAAALLMPTIALRRLLPKWPNRPEDWDNQTITGVARQLKVSAQALALRLEELGRAPEGFNRRFVFRPNKTPDQTGGGYVRTRLSEIGGRYTGSILSALERDVIDVVHASQALALGPQHLERAKAYVDRQRELASAV